LDRQPIVGIAGIELGRLLVILHRFFKPRAHIEFAGVKVEL
jgi:hypothetical protein